MNPASEEETQRYIHEIDTTVLQPITGFKSPTVNLGSVAQGEKVKQRFTFVNNGNDDLEIIDVVADCSCTSQEWGGAKER
jgi:hypothetical protein